MRILKKKIFGIRVWVIVVVGAVVAIVLKNPDNKAKAKAFFADLKAKFTGTK